MMGAWAKANEMADYYGAAINEIVKKNSRLGVQPVHSPSCETRSDDCGCDIILKIVGYGHVHWSKSYSQYLNDKLEGKSKIYIGDLVFPKEQGS